MGGRPAFGIEEPDVRFFFTSMTVAFFGSMIGIREAVFVALDVKLELDILPGLGLEKLAGEGL